MKAYEDLARLKVDEALRHGLAAQRHRQTNAVLQPVDLSALVESKPVAGPQAEQRSRHDFRRLLVEEGVRLAGAVWLWTIDRLGER